MRTCLPRLLSILLLIILLVFAASPTSAAERSWIKVQYQPGASEAMIDNIEFCLDMVADLLTEHHLFLSQPINVIATADTESYIQELMKYGSNRSEAEQKAKYTAAVSLNARPVIIIQGTAAIIQNKQEIFRVLPHEIFHQVQQQWGKLETVTWMVEGAPELFRIKASERAGFAPAPIYLAIEQRKVQQARILPSALQLGSKDYRVFSDLAAKGYPVYPMSTLMLYKLVESAGFDKVVYFYQQLHYGVSPEKAFESVFRVPMQWFLGDMDRYFTSLRER